MNRESCDITGIGGFILITLCSSDSLSVRLRFEGFERNFLSSDGVGDSFTALDDVMYRSGEAMYLSGECIS